MLEGKYNPRTIEPKTQALWESLGVHRFEVGACTACGADAWRPDTDVMDTWATSSETPQINARWGDPEGPPRFPLPMSMRPQAHDIIRTWAFYTVVIDSWIHHEALPWHDVMASGHVQAKRGEKIAKAKRNAPADPREMIEEHGADATRYWALSATLRNDYLYSQEDLKQGRRLCVKLWNAARLAAMHLEDFDPDAPPAARKIDAWIRARMNATIQLVSDNLDRYEFGIAKGEVERFFWDDLCDNYLEGVKERLYDKSDEGADARRAAQQGLYDVFACVTRLLTPYVPHVCEAVWQHLFAEREGVPSVGGASWPAPFEVADDAEAAGRAAVALLTAIRRWRSEQKISPGKPLSSVVLEAGSDVMAAAEDVRSAVVAAGRTRSLELRSGEDLAAGDVRLLEATLEEPPA